VKIGYSNKCCMGFLCENWLFKLVLYGFSMFFFSLEVLIMLGISRMFPISWRYISLPNFYILTGPRYIDVVNEELCLVGPHVSKYLQPYIFFGMWIMCFGSHSSKWLGNLFKQNIQNLESLQQKNKLKFVIFKHVTKIPTSWTTNLVQLIAKSNKFNTTVF
jgi:hypothetical protein